MSAFVLAAAFAAGGQAQERSPARAGADQVRTASNEFRKGDRVKTVPIGRNAWQEARSIMSLSPREVGALEPGRRLAVSGDAEVTVCTKASGGHGGTPCVGRTYDYDPFLKMKIVAGPSPGSTGGSNTVDLTATKSLTCSQHQPNRNRHCVLGIPWKGINIPAADRLPCAPSNCYVNMVLSADRSNAQDGDVVVVGSSDDKKRIHQGRSQLSSILFTGSDRPVRTYRRGKPYKRKLQVGPDDSAGNPQVAYSLPLGGLRAGDQLVVEGRAVTGIGSLPYNITQRTSLIFTNKPGSVKPNGKIIETNPRLSADNGYGCTHGSSGHRNPCTIGKYGVISVKKSSRKPWFVNFVVSQEASDVSPKANRWRSSDRVSISGAGFLEARKYRGTSSCADCAVGGVGTFSFSPDRKPGSKLFKRLVSGLSRFGITQGRYSCEGRSKGPDKLICKWHSEGTFGQSRKYVCDSKAYLSRKNNWTIKVCKDALGAQLWHLLQQRGIDPTYAGACKQKRRHKFVCKWFAKGERASGPYFCRGYGRYSSKTHHWDIDACRNER
ncbi:MAG TPA: hypothetical protein VFH44_09200 [Solirubrobacterales bacterium]|nr:hypothetical protein [Solirubrobacterales bacterium]